MRRPTARALYEHLHERVDIACPNESERAEVKSLIEALWRALTEDDEPVFRAPLGAFRRIEPTPR